MRKLRYDVETECSGYLVGLGGTSGGFNRCFFTATSIPELFVSSWVTLTIGGRRNLIPTVSRRFIYLSYSGYKHFFPFLDFGNGSKS